MLTASPEKPHERASKEWERLDRMEHALWRNSILLLLVLAVGLASSSWDTLRAIPPRLEVLPVGLVILVALFGAYVWNKKRELTELRGLLRGLHEAASNPPTEAQVDKLLEVISHSQRGYRDLIDSLDHAVFTLSPDGVLRVANQFMAQVCGVPFPELIGQPLDTFFAEPARPEARQALARLLERSNWSGRIPVRPKKTGELRYFDCRFQVVRSDQGVTAVSGWARDVTAQHESEVRFAELFESLREGIFFTSPEGQILDANPALVRMLGYDSKEDLLAHNFREMYVDPSRRDAIVDEMREKGSAQDRELLLLRKDGTQIHCLASGFAIRDMFGRLVRLQGTLVDVTERLEIKKRLHEEEEFVRRLVASFPDIIAVLDREARFTFVSPRIEDVLGEPPEEYVGESLGARAHADDRPKLAEIFGKVMGGQKGHIQIEFRTMHADGNWRTLRASAGPLFDEAGTITGVVASARDVTESKLSEQQLMQKEKLTSMGQMMAGVAHELNNPLTAILGISDLLRERATDDSTRRQVEIILNQARRAAAIIQNLLAFSRPATQGRAKLKVEEVVQKALQLQQVALQQKNISVEFSAPSDLPPIEGEVRLLTQVFSNLIVNAEQAISSVRDRGTLRISLARNEAIVSATFADDGAGIQPENIGKIFDPFFTTKRPGGGTGLGLTICLALVKEHGGSIEVQSSPGAGATFRVLLPVATGESAAAPRPAPEASSFSVPSPVPVLPAALRGHSALVVDDEDSIREIVQEGLTARGMKVEGAASSEEALSHLAGNSYDVILCDFNLPGLKGEQLFDRLRSEAGRSAPRFVFMTGDMLDPETIAAFGEKGAYVMQKPFHVSALATLLTDLLAPQPVKAR
jgi:PAS domain S-box-containing protein